MYIKRNILWASVILVVALLLTIAWSVATGRAYAADKTLSAEGPETGVWVVSFPAQSRNRIWVHTVNSADAKGTRFTSIACLVRDDPTLYQDVVDYDVTTPSMGTIVKVGPSNYEGSWIGYEVKAKDKRPAEITKISVSYSKWQLVDRDTAKGTLTMAVYSGSQDANGDGLPDEGQKPIARFENMEFTGKRFTMMRNL